MTVKKINNLQVLRGIDREKSLPKSAYFSNNYFYLNQLFSLAQQIHEIHTMKPESILEIGIGNGFVSTFLSLAGYTVKTADINPALNPDICAPLHEVHKFTDGCIFDVVVCCEVLEHMPLEEFETNVKYLRSMGHRLFLTLPNYKRTFGWFGMLQVPKIHSFKFRIFLDIMESTVIDQRYMNLGLDGDAALQTMAKYKQRCQIFHGDFTLLWHNCRLVDQREIDIYREIVSL